MNTNQIFVYSNNIMMLEDCCETTSFRILKDIKQKFRIIAPNKLTVDHVCIYYGITLEQYWRTQKKGNKYKPTEGAG